MYTRLIMKMKHLRLLLKRILDCRQVLDFHPPSLIIPPFFFELQILVLFVPSAPLLFPGNKNCRTILFTNIPPLSCIKLGRYDQNKTTRKN